MMEELEKTDISFSLFSSSFNFVQKIGILISTFFMVGLMPIAPGTWGSLGGLGVYILISEFVWQQQLQIIVAIMLLGVGGIALVQKRTGPKDDGRFVIDEVVGMLITVATFPVHWFWLTLGFFLFRLLDIWKPFPARYIDRHLHGAWGVMLDDVICGIYALSILKVLEALRIFL